jgi:hypothetical protein
MVNSPEYISGKLLERVSRHGVAIQRIQPGKPQQNVYIERYNRTVRHEWLGQHTIENTEEAQGFATQWLWTYSNDRPNVRIGGRTPAQKLKMATQALQLRPVENRGITVRGLLHGAGVWLAQAVFGSQLLYGVPAAGHRADFQDAGFESALQIVGGPDRKSGL